MCGQRTGACRSGRVIRDGLPMDSLNPVTGITSVVPELSANTLQVLEARCFRRDERQSTIITSEFGRLKDRGIVRERLRSGISGRNGARASGPLCVEYSRGGVEWK